MSLNSNENINNKINENKTFLSEDQYKKQTDITTKKALKELNEQINKESLIHNKTKQNVNSIILNDSNSISSEDEFVDEKYNNFNKQSSSHKNNNLIIENAQIIQNRKKRKNNYDNYDNYDNHSYLPQINKNSDNNNDDMYQLMLGQREVEVQKNIRMKQKITELEYEIDKLENRIHYLNLDMSNKNEELENIKSKYIKKKKENETIIMNNRIELSEVKVKVRSIEILNYIYLTLIAISAYYNIKFSINSY